MRWNSYSAIILAFILTLITNLNLFAQSPARIKAKHTNCGATVAEYRETPKAGVANVICPTTGFNTRNDACWQELAEYYYNVVPEPGVKIQHIYFVEVPKGTKPIRTLAELKSSPFKQKTFFECTVNMATEKFTFKNYPFAAK